MQSAARAIEILFMLEKPTRLEDIAEKLGLHRTTALRLARQLAERELVTIGPGSMARLSHGAVVLANMYRRTSPLADVLSETLEQLCESTGETASYYVPAGDGRICIGRKEVPTGLKQSVQIGQRMPLLYGAPGKAILAYQVEEVRQRLYDAAALSPEQRAKLGRDLELVRRQGFVVSLEEREAGVGSVAAPVLGHDGALQGAIGVSGPVGRLHSKGLPKLTEDVVGAARAVSKSIIYGELAA